MQQAITASIPSSNLRTVAMVTMMKGTARRRLSWLLCLLWLHSTLAQECTKDGRCDTHERCPVWANEEGECIRSKVYMYKHCPASCELLRLEENGGQQQQQQQQQQAPTSSEATKECFDKHPHCPQWAKLGECEENIDVRNHCPKSCDACTAVCADTHENCQFWADAGECKNNPNYMERNCPVSCNTCDKITPKAANNKKRNVLSSSDPDLTQASTEFGTPQKIEGTRSQEVAHKIKSTVKYMASDQMQDLADDTRTNCKNRHELCSFWAVIGECDNNKAYMATNCAPACETCHLIDLEARCPKLENADPALVPGSLNKMFERIVRQAPGNRTLTDDERKAYEESHTPIYTVHIHSRPDPNPTAISPAIDKATPPWVITLDDFLTDDECDALVQLGYKYEYKRSEDVGKRKFDGSHEGVKSERRTSENAWCSDRTGCRGEEVPTRIHERMSAVMNIPPQNSEDFQMLKYEVGQFYRTHHDYIAHQRDRQCGPRILTFFLYLSDVEKGGGTNFPQLDITVEPKRGRALLWPSVLDSDPMAKDGRMMHQALEVIEGTKFAANGWIHMYDYLTPQASGCN